MITTLIILFQPNKTKHYIIHKNITKQFKYKKNTLLKIRNNFIKHLVCISRHNLVVYQSGPWNVPVDSEHVTRQKRNKKNKVRTGPALERRMKIQCRKMNKNALTAAKTTCFI